MKEHTYCRHLRIRIMIGMEIFTPTRTTGGTRKRTRSPSLRNTMYIHMMTFFEKSRTSPTDPCSEPHTDKANAKVITDSSGNNYYFYSLLPDEPEPEPEPELGPEPEPNQNQNQNQNLLLIKLHLRLIRSS